MLLRLAPDHASPRRLRGAIVMQTLWRGYGRTNYAYVRDRIALLAEMVRFRRLSKFCLWYCNARWRRRPARRKQPCSAGTELCTPECWPKNHDKDGNAARGAKMKLAWRRLWIITLEDDTWMESARPGDTAEVEEIRTREKQSQAQEEGSDYWRAWTALQVNRRIRHASSTLIASVFRGWLFRTCAFH